MIKYYQLRKNELSVKNNDKNKNDISNEIMDLTEKQSDLLVKYIKNVKFDYKVPTEMNVPFSVLEKWSEEINFLKIKVTMLERDITELQLRPPPDGGKLFKEAQDRFHENTK
jgi:hypothetical protein